VEPVGTGFEEVGTLGQGESIEMVFMAKRIRRNSFFLILIGQRGRVVTMNAG